ncbi:hypothetical protein [Microbaculum marinum]|uniref:Uncharacterized protein n=1 Tax=Microbaculum marinum TaxID=1764581 RepID=A0AAW9RP89_9HYPH
MGQRLIWIAVVWAATLVAPGLAGADNAGRRIAILDGEVIAYGDGPPNWVVLRDTVLPAIFPRKVLTIKHFDVSAPDAAGAWINAATVAAFEPDLILAHWSAFKPPRGQDYCDITTNRKGQECAIRLLETLNDARGRDGSKAKIVIYSRKPNLCFTGTQNGFEAAVDKSSGGTPGRGLSPLLGTTGFMTMTPAPDRNVFSAAGVPSALLRLVRYLNCPAQNSLFGWDLTSGLCALGEPMEGDDCE